MMIDRYAVVTEAREWLDTPYHHQASLKGVGCDCIGLVRGVAAALGAIPHDFALPAYGRTPDADNLIDLAGQHMQRIQRDGMQIGDVVAIAFESHPQHFGILADYRHGGLSIIHAHSVSARVIETRLMFGQSFRFCAAYKLPGVV